MDLSRRELPDMPSTIKQIGREPFQIPYPEFLHPRLPYTKQHLRALIGTNGMPLVAEDSGPVGASLLAIPGVASPPPPTAVPFASLASMASMAQEPSACSAVPGTSPFSTLAVISRTASAASIRAARVSFASKNLSPDNAFVVSLFIAGRSPVAHASRSGAKIDSSSLYSSGEKGPMFLGMGSGPETVAELVRVWPFPPVGEVSGFAFRILGGAPAAFAPIARGASPASGLLRPEAAPSACSAVATAPVGAGSPGRVDENDLALSF